MAQITITINAREYAIACEDGQERRILQLARLLDDKAKMLTSATGPVNENMMLVMVALLLADDLSEAGKKNSAESSKTETVDKSRIAVLDKDLAAKIKTLTEELKAVASKINLL